MMWMSLSLCAYNITHLMRLKHHSVHVLRMSLILWFEYHSVYLLRMWECHSYYDLNATHFMCLEYHSVYVLITAYNITQGMCLKHHSVYVLKMSLSLWFECHTFNLLRMSLRLWALYTPQFMCARVHTCVEIG